MGVFLIAFVGLAAAIIFVRTDRAEREPARSPAKPTYGQLARLVDRIDRDREFLATQGILLETAGVGADCVMVWLANPTSPNVAYMRRRFPKTCVERRPMGPISGCFSTRGVTRGGPVIVPDVGDLGLVEASRRVLAAGLTFTTGCIGRARNVEWVPSNPADRLVRVVAQCPRAGQRVRRGTEVALQAKALLPGSFNYLAGAFVGCVDRRHPESR